MATPRLALPHPAAPVADASLLDRLPAAGASHDDVRRYSRARRNLLPRAEQVTAVAGGWANEVVLRSTATIETVLWCPGERRDAVLEATAAAVAGRARNAARISE